MRASDGLAGPPPALIGTQQWFHRLLNLHAMYFPSQRVTRLSQNEPQQPLLQVALINGRVGAELGRGMAELRNTERHTWWSGCSITTEDMPTANAYTLDISQEGLSIISNEPLRANAYVTIELPTFPHQPLLELEGTVAWVSEKENLTIAGVRLSESSCSLRQWVLLVSNAKSMMKTYYKAA